MDIELLEKRLNSKISEYDLQIERLKARGDIENLMGRYEVVHITPEEIYKTADLFALWRPDCSVEVSSQGVVVGPENMVKYWHSQKCSNIKCTAFFHTLASPVIQVAGNCKTAKGIWTTPGFECAYQMFEGSAPFAAWCFGKYAMDFIRHPETGKWYIWHMHYYRMSRNDYDKDFVAYAQWIDAHKELAGPPPGMPAPEYEVLPGVYHRPLSITEDTHPFPVDPEPYEDYDGGFRWQYGGPEMEARYEVHHPAYEKLYNANYPEHI